VLEGSKRRRTPVSEAQTAEQRRDEFAEGLFENIIGAMEVATVYLGDRLGLYKALADGGPTTPLGLAERTGTHERYAREWLEQQAVAGILAVEKDGADGSARRYMLPNGHAEVLLDKDSLNYLAPVARFTMGLVRPLPELADAFRNGEGLPYAEYGADAREGQAEANRPMFVNLLGSEWLPSVPDVHERLQADPPAWVADVGCGTGWSSISIARAYPKARVDGYDLDGPSIELARRNAGEAGVADRVTFHLRDASDPTLEGSYDLATAFECVHDMGRPVQALGAMRRMVGEKGAVIVADERVPDSLEAPGDDTDRLMYGWSVLFCLPTGLADEPSVGTGTVMRQRTLRRYAQEAGYRGVDVLPIENDLWRFYRLVP
jgi:SAM-dependent methyltransferase